MPHSCAGSAFHNIYTSASCWRTKAATTKQRIITYKNIVNLQKKHHAAKYNKSATVRETNSGHEPQLIEERPVI
jgi:hypothetical protein